MRKIVFLLLLMGAFGYGLAQPLAIDTAWFRHVPSAHHLTYWFDNNSASAQDLPLSQTSLQMDVSFLPLGVHTIHCYAVDSAGVVYPTSSAMFFCPPAVGSDSTAAQQVVYWFDQDFASRQIVSLQSGPQLLDVSTLAMGVHTIHSYVVGVDNTVYPTSSAMFFCPPSVGSDSTAAQQVVYWFDQDFDGRHFASLQSGPQLLDVSDLDIGVHTIHSYVVGADNKAYPTTSVMFFRLPYIDIDSAEAQEVVYWFDQDYAHRQVSSLQAGVQMLDVSALDIGVHTIHSYVVGTDSTVYPTSSAMFFRPPAIGTDSITAQEIVYWFDQDFASRHIAPLHAGVQMLDVSDLSMGVHTIHSYVVGADSTVYPTSSVMFIHLPTIGTDSTAPQKVVYWFDQDYANRHVAHIHAGMQMLDVSDLPMGDHFFHVYVMGVDSTVYPTSSAMFFRPSVPGEDTTVRLYPVIFVNFNGEVLQQDSLPYGSMPVYRGNTPVHSTNIQYTYTFVGWNPNIDTVRGAAVYTAVFDSVFSCISQYHYDNISTCDSVLWRGNVYATSGTYSEVVEGVAYGCDSVYVLNLTIKNKSYVTDEQTACDTYTWHGTTYTASTNTPTFTEQNVEGCDSVVTLHLTINHSNTGTDVQTACDSYTWHGTTYTASTNTPTFTGQNVEGCDSVVTLHLTINHSNTGTDVQTACDSYTWHGTTYTASTNTPTFIEQNVAGCDSVVTLHLTINHSTSSVFDLADCDSVTWSDWTFYASTDTTIVLTNSVGCDSLNILHLSVNYTAQTTIVDSAQGSYDWNGQTYTASGEYVFTSQTEAGCDSIVTLILTITQTEGILFDEFEQVTLYPNPTTGKVVVNGMKVICLEVYDLDGRLVGTFMNTNSFDISQLSSGTYLVRITMPQGETIRRVIKH